MTYFTSEFEGERYTRNMDGAREYEFFSKVAEAIAMSDCTDEEIVTIVYNDSEYHYAGWRPGMEFTFINNEDASDTYTVWMEHLDH